MLYTSTRGGGTPITSSEAILSGIAADGGLYAPESFPKIDARTLTDLPYHELAARVLGLYLDDYPGEELSAACAAAYGTNFDHPDVTPLVSAGDNEWVLELWHGPTRAFKDMALQILPRLLPAALRRSGRDGEVLILVATSGDTGKAAMEGFADVPGTRVLVYYPHGGVSHMQFLQMATQRGQNVAAVGVRGNFDDTQSGVKRLFTDPDFAREARAGGCILSSANSINLGRLAPQIVYYFAAYLRLAASGVVSHGELVNFVVPTGNFGNILAGYYAKRMGLPIGRLILAANENNVLEDAIKTGVYDINRPFFRTSSPSMDILISSNFERMLFEQAGRDPAQLSMWMNALKTDGRYALPDETRARLADDIHTGHADGNAVRRTIADFHRRTGYLLDTHTAVGQYVLEDYRRRSGDNAPAVLISTASPFKFPGDVLGALTGRVEGDEMAAMDALSALTGWDVPVQLKDVRSAPILHDGVIDIAGMGDRARDMI